MVRIVGVVVLVVVVALASCTSAQSRRAHNAGEVVTATALFAMLGTIVVAKAWPAEDQQIYMIGRGCIPFAVLGALVYAATDQPQPLPQPR